MRFQRLQIRPEKNTGYIRIISWLMHTMQLLLMGFLFILHQGALAYQNKRLEIDRWSGIKVVQARSLEFARAKGASMTTVDSYFKELDQILSKYNLKDSPHLIFNIDESGFMTNNKPPFVVTSSEINFKPQAVTSPRSQTVTVIGAGSASGIAVPPYFVFPGARMMPDLKCGISPFNKDAIPLLSLAPSTVFNEIGKVKDDNDNKNNNESGGNNKCTSNENSPSLFMNEKLKEIIKNKGKEKGVKRKCLSNITSEKPVTEEDVFNEIQKYKKGQKNGTKN
ncbi:hypothetical protein KUTeg_024222 [Tegillarca granosa]|uniref:Uncharacterized protein n=1 Tax=Tegillarca granosa TaxID=220873 RepID=A0ABQ9DZS3_TEGGR|nr:hypothetical protein KUTeg_024222 [Tegillarca granosa]